MTTTERLIEARKNMKVMAGIVTGFDGHDYTVTCPGAPAHLQTLLLIPRQMAGAVVGDKVQLGYHVTPSSGLWNVLWKVEGN